MFFGGGGDLKDHNVKRLVETIIEKQISILVIKIILKS